MLVQSDLLVVVPSRVARIYLQQGDLKMVDLPISLADFEVRVYWHMRHDASQPHKWLLKEIAATLGES